MNPKTCLTLISVLAILLLAWFVPCIIFQNSRPQLKWDWSKIDTDKMSFPKGCIWGVATAAHLDIRLMQDLGVKSYRFSVEWSRIEPQEGVFDTMAIRHYQEVCDSLISAGMVPMVTLHHFTNPLWFEKKGAFEKKENVADFVRFAGVVYMALKDRVNLWCTINEPAVYVVGGYFQGDMPPGKKDPKLAAVVLRNILEAHVQATCPAWPGCRTIIRKPLAQWI